VFFVPALGKTVAQLTSARKNQISHRGKALRRFARRFARLLAAEQ
jgi:XTP/dITP diphosphohydrolase